MAKNPAALYRCGAPSDVHKMLLALVTTSAVWFTLHRLRQNL